MSYDDWKVFEDRDDSTHFCPMCGNPAMYEDEPCSEECWELWAQEVRERATEQTTSIDPSD